MAINKQLWVKDFANNLYDEKDWFSFGKNFSDAVTSGIVHIPQAVASDAPYAITGTTLLPISATETTYDDLTFTMKMIVSAPKFVSNINVSEASFDTRSEEMKDMVGKLKQAISIEIADKWTTVATGSIVRTSGSATRSNIYGQASVKAMTFADVLDARTTLIKNTKDVDLDNLYLVVDPVIYSDLVQLSQFTTADNLANQVVLKGFVGEIGGFKVIQRGVGIPFTVSGSTVSKGTISYTDTHNATHFSGALAIAGSNVGYAVGTEENGQINMGVEKYATGYYSDVLQGHTRVGGSPMYKEASNVVKGLVSIVETT